ncbi:MAG TPA: hypothetical protein VE990_04760 [Acidimicrobiales bacterium]|nr:hypothetical protein [Acidimicrobiales bacterium]
MTAALRRSLTSVVLAGAIGLAAVAAATPAVAAGPGGQTNSATAVNTKSGSSLFRLAFSVVRVTGQTVDTTNSALAFASCTDCQTVAVAIQVVLVEGQPTVVSPTNQALAYNYQCSSCDTLASAFQDLVETAGPVRFTATGSRELAAVRHQLEALRGGDLSFQQVQSEVNTIESEVARIVATQLVAAGPPASGSATSAPGTAATPDSGGGTTSSTTTTSDPGATSSTTTSSTASTTTSTSTSTTGTSSTTTTSTTP